jgi:glycosyltransferase involved in cell wall biosynthesis
MNRRPEPDAPALGHQAPRAIPSTTVSGTHARLIYLAPSDVLIPRVDRQCTMQFAEALARAGVDIEVVCLEVELEYDEPTRDRDLFDVYGIATRFKVTSLPSRGRQSRGGAGPVWRALSYSRYVLWDLFARRRVVGGPTILYLRNYLLALPFLAAKRLLRTRPILLFEVHVPPARSFQRWVLRHVDGIVAISGVLQSRLSENLGVDASRILVAHQGIKLELIESMRLERDEARARLGLSTTKTLAVYTGKVYDGYGEIDLLLQTARRLPDDVQLIIVGGREDHVHLLRERTRTEGPDNVRFIGFVPPSEAFHYQMAADMLLSYYPGNIDLNDFRSPGKLFEYMASGNPIVTADYPSLREVLGDDAAIFVERDNPDALARAVEQLVRDTATGARMARNAYDRVQEFTWQRRAEEVIAFADRLRSSVRNGPGPP